MDGFENITSSAFQIGVDRYLSSPFCMFVICQGGKSRRNVFQMPNTDKANIFVLGRDTSILSSYSFAAIKFTSTETLFSLWKFISQSLSLSHTLLALKYI